ncbi:hypothetical protein CWI38_1488p0030, partial [Hamiltosporidium tvaerminnensis]
MSALFNFDSLMRVSVLVICTSTYIKKHFPSMISKESKGISSVFYKSSVIGERLSPYVSITCIVFGFMSLKSLVF